LVLILTAYVVVLAPVAVLEGRAGSWHDEIAAGFGFAFWVATVWVAASLFL